MSPRYVSPVTGPAPKRWNPHGVRAGQDWEDVAAKRDPNRRPRFFRVLMVGRTDAEVRSYYAVSKDDEVTWSTTTSRIRLDRFTPGNYRKIRES